MAASSGEILVVDLGSDARESISLVVEGLRKEGVRVTRPIHRKEMSKSVRLSSNGHFELPRLLVHFDLEMPNAFSELVKIYELTGVKVINPWQSSSVVYNRIGLAALLKRLQIPYPNFYYGNPKAIPPDFGEHILCKDVTGHLVQVVQQSRIHASSELAYYEEILPNSTNSTITVYWIFGHLFAVSKPDILTDGKSEPTKTLLPTIEPAHLAITVKIQQATQFRFFNVEFIGDTVIDVNPYPNPFCHPEAISWLIQGFLSEL